MQISREELYNVWYDEKQQSKKTDSVSTYVLAKIGLGRRAGDRRCKDVHQAVHNFIHNLKKKWIEANRTKVVFEASNKNWLSGMFLVPDNTSSSSLEYDKPSTSKRGRPPKEFLDQGERAKRMKVAPLLETWSPEELSYAAGTSLNKSGMRDAANIVKALGSSASEATTMKKKLKFPCKETIRYTSEKALVLFIDGSYTKYSYNLMRTGAKTCNADIYPSYHKLLAAKKECYPKDGINVSDTSAEVSLQSLVDHTTRRLLKHLKEVLSQHICCNLTLSYKWGCDGSSGHSRYKQKFDNTYEEKTDEYLFAICLVPLQLKDDDKLIWHNPRPSSVRFCRPIKLIFEKETKSLVEKEIDALKSQIAAILPTQICQEGEAINVTHKFYMTMIDGKIFSTIANTSSQCCGICGASPKIMNDLSALDKLKPKESLYEYGLSTLHAWIRCFECVLHIAYKLNVRKWQTRSDSDKAIKDARKKTIIERLKKEMGLLVDIPKPGCGTTNDGNTARRFFQQPTLTSVITGIDEDFINRFAVILRTMSCGFAINVEAFRAYTMDTARLYIKLYSWYYMPASVHKILLHGADIIQYAALPIGILSEEALESRNKDFRNIRENHTRKFSREKTMYDLFHYLLLSSDPLVSSLSTKASLHNRSAEPLSKEVISLLSDASAAVISDIQDDSESSEDSD